MLVKSTRCVGLAYVGVMAYIMGSGCELSKLVGIVPIIVCSNVQVNHYGITELCSSCICMHAHTHTVVPPGGAHSIQPTPCMYNFNHFLPILSYCKVLTHILYVLFTTLPLPVTITPVQIPYSGKLLREKTFANFKV